MTGQPLQIQTPRRPRGGLADVAGALPMSWGDGGWNWGVQVTPSCLLDRTVWGCASTGLKPNNGIEPSVNFDPTTFAVAVNCGPNGEQSPIGDIARQLAVDGLERWYWSDLAVVLSEGEVGAAVPNPSLRSEMQPYTGFVPATPECIMRVISGLLQQQGDCYDADVVFHVNRMFLPYFVSQQIVLWDEGRGVWHMGPYDFSFDSYPNLGSAAIEGADPTLTDGTEAWIYMTPRPLAATAPEQAFSSTRVRQNLYQVAAEVPGIVVFNPCCVWAGKALVGC